MSGLFHPAQGLLKCIILMPARFYLADEIAQKGLELRKSLRIVPVDLGHVFCGFNALQLRFARA